MQSFEQGLPHAHAPADEAWQNQAMDALLADFGQLADPTAAALTLDDAQQIVPAADVTDTDALNNNQDGYVPADVVTNNQDGYAAADIPANSQDWHPDNTPEMFTLGVREASEVGNWVKHYQERGWAPACPYYVSYQGLTIDTCNLSEYQILTFVRIGLENACRPEPDHNPEMGIAHPECIWATRDLIDRVQATQNYTPSLNGERDLIELMYADDLNIAGFARNLLTPIANKGGFADFKAIATFVKQTNGNFNPVTKQDLLTVIDQIERNRQQAMLQEQALSQAPLTATATLAQPDATTMTTPLAQPDALTTSDMTAAADTVATDIATNEFDQIFDVDQAVTPEQQQAMLDKLQAMLQEQQTVDPEITQGGRHV